MRDQVVQYKDVGTKLTVRPTISIDGTVQLNVVAGSEQRDDGDRVQRAGDLDAIGSHRPPRPRRADDRAGRADRPRARRPTEGIPFFSSIPFIGGLFGRQARNTTETELFIFLTPRVIRTDEDAERLTSPLRKRADR